MLGVGAQDIIRPSVVIMATRYMSVQCGTGKHGERDREKFPLDNTTRMSARTANVEDLAICVDDILYSWTIGHRDGDIEKQTQLGKALLSVFVLVDLGGDDRGLKPLRPLSALLDLAKPPPTRGVAVEIHSTPFGCEAFLNAVTRGAVCGVVGKRPSLLLTDAATALGSEGGPVFSDNELIGMVVCSVSWWRGEWVGLTLVAPLMVVLANKLRVAPPSQLAPLTSENLFLQHILSRIDSTTVLVRCGASWGTGIYIGGGFVLTCAHVVKNHESHSVSLYCQGSRATAKVRYKTRDDRAFDLALIYSNLESWGHLTKAQFATAPAIVGESVLAAGYPYFNENNLEELRPTITAGHVNTVSPSMLQTSCCVQSGFSGGAIYRLRQSQPNMTLEVVGIIVSNARTNKEACYPYINMAVPAQAFDKQIQEYLENKDTHARTDARTLVRMHAHTHAHARAHAPTRARTHVHAHKHIGGARRRRRRRPPTASRLKGPRKQKSLLLKRGLAKSFAYKQANTLEIQELEESMRRKTAGADEQEKSLVGEKKE
ncbi:Peroxisomal leader peptide-processing protease [Eumeta japonica]|uniref:Peroxisomal leader peptide-processing protease n=1 Tax=Eumeta variegata TaxID=151549 RepID=A0A4C1ZR79_EUMVA|nr:Peroxisomal leader peptide-processing protease [Eumeta japonica]